MRKLGLYLNGNNPLEAVSSLDKFHYKNLRLLYEGRAQFVKWPKFVEHSFVMWSRKQSKQLVAIPGGKAWGDSVELWKGPRTFTLQKLFQIGVNVALGAEVANVGASISDLQTDQSSLNDESTDTLATLGIERFASKLSVHSSEECMLLLGGHGEGPAYNLMSGNIHMSVSNILPDDSLKAITTVAPSLALPSKKIPRVDFTLNWLSNSELIEGLKRAKFTEATKLDVLAFDVCQQATIESAFELGDVARFLIASELDIPYQGWNYADSCKAFFENESLENRVRLIVEGYRRRYELVDGTPLTLTGIDLSKLRWVARPLCHFVDAMLQSKHNRERLTTIGRSMRSIPSEGLRKVDFRTLFSLIAECEPWNGGVQDIVVSLLSVFDAAIENRFWANSSAKSKFDCTGLSIVLPTNKDDFTVAFKEQYLSDKNELRRFRTETRWHELLAVMMAET